MGISDLKKGIKRIWHIYRLLVKMDSNFWNIKLQTLTIFHKVLEDPVIKCLSDFFQADSNDVEERIKKYCHFVAVLYTKDPNFSRYIYQLVMNDENVVVHTVAAGKPLPESLSQALDYELNLLKELAMLKSKDLADESELTGFLPQWENTEYDFKAEYQKHLDALPQEGYGMFAKYRTFCLTDKGITPIAHPDPQRLSDLVGYQKERAKVIKNTLAFLQDVNSHNVLLYGDAGTGKSSTIKAIVNEYYEKGLRLIEVKKHQLRQIPSVMEDLAGNPLHFILFIDDLSFESNDDDFIALKNILEGGVQHANKNIRVYATSNRRHFVKENMDDRAGSEVFRNDAIQETVSLAARFGLTVTFQKPKKDLYSKIVLELAKRSGLNVEKEELLQRAEAFAIRNNGRSPRTAKQFIEMEKINEVIEDESDE